MASYYYDDGDVNGETTMMRTKNKERNSPSSSSSSEYDDEGRSAWKQDAKPHHPRRRTTTTTTRRRTENGTTVRRNDRYSTRLAFYSFVWSLDACATLVLAIPFVIPGSSFELSFQNYRLHDSLFDLLLLSLLRLLLTAVPVLFAYVARSPLPPLSPRRDDGALKTPDEVEEEAWEEPLGGRLRRFLSRGAVLLCAETLVVLTLVHVVAKCLARLRVVVDSSTEFDDNAPWWFAIACAAVACACHAWLLDGAVRNAAACGGRRPRRRRRRRYDDLEMDDFLEGLRGEQDWDRSGASDPYGYEYDRSLIDTALAYLKEDGEQQKKEEESVRSSTTEPFDNENDDGVSDTPLNSDNDARCSSGWRDLRALLRRDLPLVMVALVFLILAAAAQVCVPSFAGRVLDSLSERYEGGGRPNVVDRDYINEDVWENSGFALNVQRLVVASLLAGLFAGLRGAAFTVLGGRFVVRMRADLVDSVLSQEVGFFDATRTGEISNRLVGDTTLVGDQVMVHFNVLLRSVLQVFGVLVFMFEISWRLTMLVLVSVPIITLTSKWYRTFVRRLVRLQQKKLADGNSVVEPAIGNMATVRAFGAETTELDAYLVAAERYLSINHRSAAIYVGYQFLLVASPNLVTSLVLFYGGLSVRSGDLTVGRLVGLVLYAASLAEALRDVGESGASLARAVGAADRVFELTRRTPRTTTTTTAGDASVFDAAAKETGTRRRRRQRERRLTDAVAARARARNSRGRRPDRCWGGISLINVDMHYPTRPNRKVLDGVNLAVVPGSIVALVGPSGGGKSTIVSLIQRLYEPTCGEVRIDGHNVNDLSSEWLNRHVSVVEQEPVLFSRSIRRNIVYGLEDTSREPSFEQVREAARLANAAEFIEALPDGYDTNVGDRGVQLSGGQKQRIAIARALVRKPRILLLDEATLALDSYSEHAVQQSIDGIVRNRNGNGNEPSMTVLIVTHRLSTIRNADGIWVVDEGKIREQGTHESLWMIQNGLYGNMLKKQMLTSQNLYTN